MAVTLTWHNALLLAGLTIVILLAFVSASAFIVQWRMEGIQYQLDDRLTLYQREIDRINERLNKLEDRR